MKRSSMSNRSRSFLYRVIVLISAVTLFLSPFLQLVWNKLVLLPINPYQLYTADMDAKTKLLLEQHKCLEESWNFPKLYHSKAPIHFIPKSTELVLPVSKNITLCDNNQPNNRLVMVFNRVGKPLQREAIRKTYGNLEELSLSTNRKKYSLIFVVGKPKDDDETKMINAEFEKFGDIAVLNITEHLFSVPYKYLIGFKLASCYCPNADYVIKADDDTYLRITKLDYVIDELQNMADNGTFRDQIPDAERFRFLESEGHVRFYTGARCGSNLQPSRGGNLKVSVQEYPNKFWPFSCYGPFNIFSMASVKELARDCPFHCTGQSEKNLTTNVNEFCLHRLEDVFMGSCIAFTQRGKTLGITINRKLAIHVALPREMNRTDARLHMAVHGNKSPDKMYNTHQYYETKGLL